MVIILLEDEKNIQPLSINAPKTTSEAPLIVLDGCLVASEPRDLWYTYPSEKYESQLGSLFPIYGKKCSKPPISYYWIQPLVVTNIAMENDP